MDWCNWLGHKFRGRWDYDVPEELKKLRTNARSLEIFMRRAYVRDVCERCGKIITRGGTSL